MSSTKKITSFFVANSSVSSVEDKKAEAEPDKKKCRRTNPSPKTVKKWEDELKITLNTERDQDGNVCKMFCEICVEHRADQTSSVSNFHPQIFIIYLIDVWPVTP
ncbi:hypothetical protein DPMN_012358 [Dreissena polymorpha]|uniref:Uncharacterized protein n=1 Tax=Dreissena polymorpha TaxID=45954 RepID=A0A9D4N5P4_DREPO|nr:hypothetical protein DPMN_144846 [Dreissena polymorpha]KAH3888326.1 hypothetical protein DPMN_012358 [Dreissena polymorpha]